MFHILICDDQIRDLVSLDRRVGGHYGGKCNLALFLDPRAVCDYVARSSDVALAFLSAESHHLNGFTLARLLRSQGYEGQLVIVNKVPINPDTLNETHALAHLCKPIQPQAVEALLAAFDALCIKRQAAGKVSSHP